MSGAVVSETAVTHREIQALYRIMAGHIYFQTLSAAVRFDLFGLLKRQGPLTRVQIARELGIAEKPARILLLGCTALDLLRKDGPLYSNSNLADHMLVRDEPGNVCSVIDWQHYINYHPMFRFADALKSGENVGLEEVPGSGATLYERLAQAPELEKVFQDAMHDISVQANALLAEHVDLSGVRHLVDVGGGDGTNIITLAEKYPEMRATVFDSPSVCRIAKRNIERAGLSDRLDAQPGNCFADPFPEADCLLFCHFFTIWSEQRNRSLLEKCYRSLPRGGRVIIFNMMQDDDETGPLSAAMGSPYFLTLATGEGMLYTWSEYESWIREAGFDRVERHELPKDHGAIIGTRR